MYPLARLAEVLVHRKAFITIDDTQTYRRCRVQSYGKGIVLRDIVTGADIKTKLQQVCRAGEFLVAEIDAKVGGFGIVPSDLDGAVVSSHYFLFTLDDSQIDQSYLSYYVRTPEFQDQVTAQGSTNYAAIRPHHVLEYVIPLPPLDEQRRIVAHIDALAEQIAVARGLRQGAVEEAESVLGAEESSIFGRLIQEEHNRLDSAAILERGKFSFRPRNDPRFFGGDHPWIQIAEIQSARKYIRNYSSTLNDDGLAISRKFARGTLLISIAATIGAIGILDFDCCVPDSIVAVTPRTGYESEFIYYYLDFMRSHLEEIAPQSAQKNINLKILAELPFPEISLDDQRRIVAYLDSLQAELERLEHLQAESAAELDALLPSLLDRAFRGEL